MPYDLISDGKPVPLGDRKYLLSPQDLAGLEVLPELVRAGVSSLKIEGRLKSPEYVANITRIYRQALDQISEGRVPRGPNYSDQSGTRETRPSDRYDMEMAFSRGLFTGWFGGTDNQKLVHARFGKKRGVFLGEIKQVLRDAVVVKLEGALKPGDGVVFDAGKPEEREEGGRVYEVHSPKSTAQSRQLVELRFGRGDVDFSRIRAGDKLWKTDDPELNRRLRQSFEGDAPKFQRPIEMEVHGLAGKPLTVIARDEFGNVAKAESSVPLAKAKKLPLTEEKLREQLGRLGGTPFRLGGLKNLLAGEITLPVSELNRLRRATVVELERLRVQPKRWTLSEGRVARVPLFSESATRVTRTSEAELIVLARNLAQLEATLKCGVTTVYCEFEDPKKYREAVQLCRETGVESREPNSGRFSTLGPRPSTIFVAPPRIFKTGEEWTLEQVRSCNADGYLVRNYDHLNYFTGHRRVGDYTLNIANRISADYFKNKFRLERVTASYDLNFSQLEALLRAAPPEWFEVTIHQHMPMFHMEHCVFCAFLSSGRDYRDCGRPCDRHNVKLRDRVGAEHPVKADAGCRNTVFNAAGQSAAEHVGRMLALGVRHFRIELLNETPEQARRTISKYRQFIGI